MKKYGDLNLFPSVRRRLKKTLAVRDGLARMEDFDITPDPYVRCSECDALYLFSDLTIGHIIAREDGGTHDDENLRLECVECNTKILELRRKGKGFKSKRYREGIVYDCVRVLDIRNDHIAHTSIKQADRMVQGGLMEILDRDEAGKPKVIRLTRDIEIEAREVVPIPNCCVICDARRYLSLFTYWPFWHPEFKALRRTRRSAALCRKCYGIVSERYAALFIEISLRPPALEKPVRLPIVVALCHARNRLKDGEAMPPEIETALKEASIDPSMASVNGKLRTLRAEWNTLERTRQDAIRRRTIETKFDFMGFFWGMVEQERSNLRPFVRTEGDQAIRLLRSISGKHTMKSKKVKGGTA